MPLRYVSKEQLAFTIEGKPFGRGRSWGHGVAGKEAYAQLVKLGAKMAMAETKWKMTNDAVYLVIVAYVLPLVRNRVLDKKKRIQPKDPSGLATGEPRLNRMVEIICKALAGVVYKSQTQIAGITIVKKFSTEPRVEVLVGKPKDYKELAYDLRNA